MHFHLIHLNDDEGRVEVWFKSSKESVYLGTLKFVDSDGDLRYDIQQLLMTFFISPMAIIELNDNLPTN